ncbi:MAG: hypothetical protein JF614_03525 [Acidobacteria bacterium]|nr:hypothetical protein [Acidobacteriota bacterium]
MPTSKVPQVPSRLPSWWWVAMVVLVVVAALTVARGLLMPFRDLAEGVAAKQSVEAGSKETGLWIRGWVDRNRALVGEPFKVWFTFVNSAAQDAEVENLRLYSPGFRPLPAPAGKQGELRVGGIGPGFLPLSAARVRVPAGRRLTLWVEMTPAERQGLVFVTGSFAGKVGQKPFQETVELGPIRLASPGLQVAAQVADSLFSLVGTLALPLALALLGWYFQQRQQWLAQERQAWNTMLPISHKNNIDLYVPLLSGLLTLKSRLAEFRGMRTQESCREVCFYLLFSMRRMREIDSSGGFYLMDRMGESLLVQCWSTFLVQARSELPMDSVRELLDLMGPAETFAGYQRKLAKSTKRKELVEAIEKRFQNWAGGTPRALGLEALKLLYAVLDFELNRIYKFWYGDDPIFPAEDCRELFTILQPGFPELGGQVECYVQKLTGVSLRVTPAGKEEAVRSSRSG